MKHQDLPKSEKTRRFIVEKAAPIFNKKGYAGTSLSDLTQATGLTKGSIYGNFKNKDEVALAAFQYNVRNIAGYFAHEMEKMNTCIDKLLVYPKTYRKIYRSMVAYGGCPILNTATEADDTHQALCKLTVEAIAAWKKSIINLLETAKNNGEAAKGTDPEKIAQIMLSLFEGGGILAKITHEEGYIQHAVDHVEHLIESLRA